MDEQAFVKENRPRWERLEEILRKAGSKDCRGLGAEDLADLGRLYRRVSSDLSLAAARGAGEEFVIYLNELVGRAHGLIYVTKRGPILNAIRFLVHDFPDLFRANLKPIGLSTLIFAIGALFAFGLVRRDASALGVVVPGWIGKDISRDLRDAPASLGIPDELKPVLSAGIMVNNITVSIAAFATGAAFGVPTALALTQNGMMLGGLAAFFTGGKRALQFWALILPHGIIELTAIFIAGGAGMILAGAMIRPGNISRLDALRLASRTAIRLMGGVVALLAIAGIIEGFITPSGISATAKLLFAGMTAIALGVYLFGGRRAGAKAPG